jgi:L-lactate dehydrogenase complex protein LldG
MSDTSRAAIFAAMRAASSARASAPRAAYAAPRLDASVATFAASLAAAGGALVRCEASALGSELAQLAANAAHVWSELAELAPRGCGLTVREPRELAALEVAVLRGALAVAENGAVWHAPRTPLERAAALLAEQLVLVVDESALVGSLHDAYARISPAAHALGWFLAGPSKTADIEQALVLGAHGPCACTVVLIR